jgi:hypothetical protein
MTTVSKWFAELFGFGLRGAKAEAVKLEDAAKNEVEILKKSLQCGCGRSPTGSCLGLHKLSEEEWLTHEVNPNRIIAAVVQEVEEVKVKVNKDKKEVVDELKEVEQKIEAAINETVAEIKKVKKSKAKKA